MNGEETVIDVQDLEVGYEHLTVLRGVTFSVKRGEAFAVLGPSGCGKTTLLKAMLGLVPRRKGRIRITGRDFDGETTPSWLRERVGVLFQSGALLGGYTVAENVALPLKELTPLPEVIVDRMVQTKLDLVRLGEAGHLSPSELSGGMIRRVALARAMALDAEVLFCDEPASGLDPATARDMDELLVELNVNVGITLVVVSHELGTIEDVSTRCIMLDADAKGIIASGSPDELIHSDDPRVRRFFCRRLDVRAEDRRR